jgi:chromosome partitioning protein
MHGEGVTQLVMAGYGGLWRASAGYVFHRLSVASQSLRQAGYPQLLTSWHQSRLRGNHLDELTGWRDKTASELERAVPVIVSFVSQKGGVGKSTLARALLAVAAFTMKTRLADLDHRQASVVAWKRARARHGGTLAGEVVAYPTITEALGASGDVELLIIDAPAGATRSTLDIARHSHLVVQPTGASADDLVPAILTFHELVKEGVPKDRLVVAVCRTLSEGEEAVARAYVKDAGYEVLPGALPERIGYREAQNRGQAVTETKSEKLNADADALMEALLAKVTREIRRRGREGEGKRKERR